MVDYATLVEQIKQKKDQLRLRIHLGSMEAKREWERLEAKWRQVAAEAGLRETSRDVQQGLRALAEELRKGYEKLEAAVAAGQLKSGDGEGGQEVEALAYRLWEERGRPIGSPEEDWLRAEEMLRERQAAAK